MTVTVVMHTWSMQKQVTQAMGSRGWRAVQRTANRVVLSPQALNSRQTRNGRGDGDPGGEGPAGAEGQNAGSASKQSDRFRGESEAELAKGDA
jgi:hypothetical protein